MPNGEPTLTPQISRPELHEQGRIPIAKQVVVGALGLRLLAVRGDNNRRISAVENSVAYRVAVHHEAGRAQQIAPIGFCPRSGAKDVVRQNALIGTDSAVVRHKFNDSTSIEIRARNEDVQNYLDSRLSQSDSKLVRDFNEEIKTRIIERVDGMFVSGIAV
jgi:hypothetical protein